MRQVGLRVLGAGVLASTIAMQMPSPAFANFMPPGAGGQGATVSGVVIDPPRNDPSQKKGEVVSSTNPNSLWLLAGAGVALAILVNGNGSDATPILGDCADLFDDLFDTNRNGEASSDCGGRHGNALMGGLISAAFTLPDAGRERINLESRLAQTLIPQATPEHAVTSMHAVGAAALERLGQPEGTRVTIGLDQYLMPDKTYPATFTVRVAPGAKLDQPLYLVAADLTQAGRFDAELGLPFAVPVDMAVLRATGSWSYTTPYTATGGAYFIDGYVSTSLPTMLKHDSTDVAQIIDAAKAQVDKAERLLKGARGDASIAAKLADRDAAQAKYLWLLEWSRAAQ